MPDQTLTEVTVETADLRNALQSVSVHASTTKDEPIECLRHTRLTIDPQLITVYATNRFSAGMAIVSVEEDHTGYGELVDVELAPDQIRELLALFPEKDGSGESAVLTSLRLKVTSTYLIATDVTGLFGGKTMQWPRVAVDSTYPDVRKVVTEAVQRVGGEGSTRLHTNGTLLALFRAPARLYGQPLVVEPTLALSPNDDGTERMGALVVSCGDSFLGLLMPVNPSDDQLVLERGWRRDWLRRLGVEELVPA